MHLPIVPPPLGPMITLYTLMGALAAMLANRGLEIFHDGLRPMMPALYEDKSMTRAQVSAISFALMIGFFIGFGVPFSIGKVIPLVYLIFLVTDWIGITMPGSFEKGWYRDSKSLMGLIGSGILGGAWGAFMAVGVGTIPNLAKMMPVDMLNPMTEITPPLISAFVTFPILAVGYRFGLKNGLIALLISLVIRQISILLGAPSGDPWVLASGTIILLIFAVKATAANVSEGISEDIEANKEMENMFITRVNRIKSSIIPIVLLSVLIGIAMNYPVMALDPPQGPLYAEGRKIEAAIALVSIGIAFFPMKFTTALLSGAMMTFSFFDGAIAILMPNWIIAGIAVGVWRFIEIYLIIYLGRLLNKFPSIRTISDDIRTTIYNAMEIGLLIGSAIAANKIAPGWGFMIIPAIWWINEYAKAPFVRMGVGPMGVIVVGILANIFKLIGLIH